jgi:uncharacterized protein (TIRG00374 family)
LKWLVTVALIVLLVVVVDIRATLHTLGSADPRLMVAALVLAMLDRVFMFAKWLPLLRVLVPTVSTVRVAKVYLASSFAAVFLPASLGGEILRAYGLRGEHAGGAIRAGASIVMERLLGIVGLCLLVACVSALAANDDPRLEPLIFVAIGMGLLAGGLIIIPELVSRFNGAWDRVAYGLHANRWLNLLGRFVEAYGVYRGHKRILMAVGVASFFEQLLPVLVIWTLAEGLDIGVHFTMVLVVVPVTLLLQRLPISVGGFGVGEGVMVYLFGFFGIAPSAALAVALSGKMINLASSLPGVFFWSEISRGRARATDRATTFGQRVQDDPSSNERPGPYSD